MRISISMPSVFEGEYVPTVCKTLESRRHWLSENLPKSVVAYVYNNKYDVRAVREASAITFFYTEDDDIHYFMRLQRLKIAEGAPPFLKKYGVYQGSVWRSENLDALVSDKTLPETVFWQLQKHNRIIWSDISQSKDGMRFWHKRITEAVNENKAKVYAVEFSAEGKTAKIVDHKRCLSLRDALPYWTDETPDGTDIGCRWRFALI